MQTTDAILPCQSTDRTNRPTGPIDHQASSAEGWACEDLTNLIDQPTARDWSRTSTPLRAHGPQPCASAYSATRAVTAARWAKAITKRGATHPRIDGKTCQYGQRTREIERKPRPAPMACKMIACGWLKIGEPLLSGDEQ